MEKKIKKLEDFYENGKQFTSPVDGWSMQDKINEIVDVVNQLVDNTVDQVQPGSGQEEEKQKIGELLRKWRLEENDCTLREWCTKYDISPEIWSKLEGEYYDVWNTEKILEVCKPMFPQGKTVKMKNELTGTTYEMPVKSSEEMKEVVSPKDEFTPEELEFIKYVFISHPGVTARRSGDIAVYRNVQDKLSNLIESKSK